MNTDAVEFRLFFAQRQDVNQNGSVMMKKGGEEGLEKRTGASAWGVDIGNTSASEEASEKRCRHSPSSQLHPADMHLYAYE